MQSILKKVVCSLVMLVSCTVSNGYLGCGFGSCGVVGVQGRSHICIGSFANFNILHAFSNDVYLKVFFDTSVSRVNGISLKAFDMVRMKRGCSKAFSGSTEKASDHYKNFINYFDSSSSSSSPPFFQTFVVSDSGESVKRSALDLNISVGTYGTLDKYKNIKVLRSLVLGVMRDAIEMDSPIVSSAFVISIENKISTKAKRELYSRQGIVDISKATKPKASSNKFACVVGSIKSASLLCPYLGMCWDMIMHIEGMIGSLSFTSGVSLLGISHYVFQTHTFDFMKSVIVEKDDVPQVVEWRLAPKVYNNVISSDQFLAGLTYNISAGVGTRMSNNMYVGISMACRVNLLIENVRASDMWAFDEDEKYSVFDGMHKYTEMFPISTKATYLKDIANKSANVFMLYRKRFCSPFSSVSYKIGIHCIYNI